MLFVTLEIVKYPVAQLLVKVHVQKLLVQPTGSHGVKRRAEVDKQDSGIPIRTVKMFYDAVDEE